VAAHAYTLVPAPLFLDNGVRGRRLDRPALDRLRDQARLGELEAVILLAPARFARSSPPQWGLLQELNKAGGRVIVLATPCGEAPHGQR
jgi:site-specific DNA recombinase